MGISFKDDNEGVAVGDNGTILRTTDAGATWTNETSAVTSRDLYDVTYTGSRYIIVGLYGTILTGNAIGIEENNEEYQQNFIFPNPTQYGVRNTCETFISDVLISDMLGNAVLKQTYWYPGTDLDVSDLPAGIYMVTSGDLQINQKLIKQ